MARTAIYTVGTVILAIGLVGCASETEGTAETDSGSSGSSGSSATDPSSGTGASEATSTSGGDGDGDGDDAACSLGAEIFDESVVHELNFELAAADWSAMVQEAADSPEYEGPDKTYFNASLSYDGSALDSQVAIRLKGHSSLLSADGHAFPLKLDIDRVDETQTLDGLTKLNLHASMEGITAVNEYLSYGAIRSYGVPTARVGFTHVSVNGEDLGLYTMVEHIKGKFLKCHFAQPQRDLYKPEEPVGNLNWLGASIDDYQPQIQFKWPDISLTEHRSVLNLLDVVNHESVDSFESVLDTTGVLTYLAMNTGVGNYDYYASYGHNFYLYETSVGRFTMIPWDMNFSQTEVDHPCGHGRNGEEWPVSNKLLGSPEHVQTYLGILKDFLEGPASAQSLNARIDSILPLLGDDLDLGAVEELREIIDYRVEVQLEAIAAGVDSCPEFTD